MAAEVAGDGHQFGSETPDLLERDGFLSQKVVGLVWTHPHERPYLLAGG